MKQSGPLNCKFFLRVQPRFLEVEIPLYYRKNKN